ncbi:MAG: RNA polymerase sigma factor [Bryobacteraceae bacterium]
MDATLLLGGVYIAGRMEIEATNPADLVRRIMAGDSAAEEELVHRYSRGVFFVLNQNVSDREIAEDLYQETFRLTLEKIRGGEVREPERFSGFILSIARNLAIEHFRKNTRARERQGEENESRTIAAPDPSQLDHLLKEERATLVHHVLAALPSERDRKVLRRFYIADDDKEEICADLGISSLHFNQILCRARERYRKAFDELSRAGGK